MIKNLKEFEEIIQEISEENSDVHQILFRGQVDADWGIKSSLERVNENNVKCEDYYKHIDSMKPLINPIINKKFERVSTMAGYPINFDEYDSSSWSLPEIEYITYLRHHGFPTPIIDWTESSYIALFFACENFLTSKTNGKVFMYNEKIMGTVGGNNIPGLRRIGRYIETDKRHFPQQAQYLVPVLYSEEWNFVPFKKLINDGTNIYDFREIQIQNTSKKEIIKDLRKMNINRYTMYLDEDSLIKNFADEYAIENGNA